MKIAWYGQSCFKLTVKANNGDKIIIFTDPFDKSIGLTPPRGNANIVTVSHDHYDHNNIKALSGDPFIVGGPGEYDIKDLYIQGINSSQPEKTIYTIEAEGIKICHLGTLKQSELDSKEIEAIGEVDILLIPIGGKESLDSQYSSKFL